MQPTVSFNSYYTLYIGFTLVLQIMNTIIKKSDYSYLLNFDQTYWET